MLRLPVEETLLSEAIEPWRVVCKEETGSTNADAVAAARAGAAEGLVIAAEAQTAGRGRLGRSWVSPPRAGLALSMLLRPRVEMTRWGWLPLLTGLVAAEVVGRLRKPENVEVGVKWPNDVLVDGRKCGGILAEVAGPGAVVVGIGLNVSLAEADLPVTPSGLPAISLLVAGFAEVDRTALAADFVNAFRVGYERWQTDPGALRQRYLGRCLTIGREVRILLPDGEHLVGTATTVDDDGRLVVRGVTGELCPIAAGDVTHVR